MTSLTVVVYHVAGLREVMHSASPDPSAAAIVAQLAGADGIAVHLHEDHQPIQERDLRLLRHTVRGRLILHMAATSEMMGFALYIKPKRVILVPTIQDEAPAEDGFWTDGCRFNESKASGAALDTKNVRHRHKGD